MDISAEKSVLMSLNTTINFMEVSRMNFYSTVSIIL